MTVLEGLRVVEIEALGPVPFAAMQLADLGADVVRIDSPPRNPEDPHDHEGPIWRGRGSMTLNLKDPGQLAQAREIIGRADVLLEGFRPGVMERLGLGPDQVCADNPGLVYARMTGWGQTGPLSSAAGHDINYLALGGILRGIARRGERPLPPLNLVGDYGGGGMLLVVGVLAALLERSRSGRGQVVDAAMLDGAALLMSSVFGWRGRGTWHDEPGTNMIDSGAPFYEVYTTKDGRHLAVGSIEPRFYRLLLEGLELDPASLPDQFDRDQWPLMKDVFADRIATRDLADWVTVFDGVDACVSPVLSVDEALADEHVRARGTYEVADGYVHPSPAPRFSRTTTVRGHSERTAEDLAAVLTRWSAGA